MTKTEKRKIFVIDDDQADCELIAQTLDYKEFEIITINDLESAIQKAEYIRPDLIFISLSLSWAPVAEAIKSIQSYKGMKRVPFVALTSLPGDLNTLYAGTMGIVDIIEKPINTEELLSKTLNILGEDLISPDKGSLFQGFSAKSKPQETPLQENIFKTEGTDQEPVISEDAPQESFFDNDLVETDETDQEPVISKDAPQESFFDNDLVETDETDQEPVISEDKPQESFFDKDTVETEETEYEPVNIKKTASDAVNYIRNEPASEKEFWGEIDDKHSGTRKDIIKKRLFIFVVLLISIGLGVKILFVTGIDEKIKQAISSDSAEQSVGSSLSGDISKSTTSAEKDELSDTYPDSYLVETPEKQELFREETFTDTFPTQEKRQVPPKSDFLKKATYSIQIGAYRDENNAISINADLTKKGYPSFIKKGSSDGTPLFKIMVGKFETRDRAEEESRILRQKEGISSFIIAY